jgi:hypothetical protein
VQRRTREARAKEDAKKQAIIEEVERDNSIVMELHPALLPAFALLCANCGRLLPLKREGCQHCGYGLLDAPAKQRRWFQRGARRMRDGARVGQFAPDIPWLPEPPPALTRALPWCVAAIVFLSGLWGFFSYAASISSGLIADFLRIIMTMLVFAAAVHKGRRHVMLLLVPVIATIVLFVLWGSQPLEGRGWIPWAVLGVTILIHAVYVQTQLRGTMRVLWWLSVVATCVAFAQRFVVHGS